MDKIFFESWDSILKTSMMASLGYIAMVFILRISGKRTLSKMNAFDFVVTIALGSCLATIATNKNVTLADGFAAFTVFIFFQFLLSWLSVRIPTMKKIITSVPTLIFYKGEFLRDAMRKERISEEEISKAGRMQGFAALDQVEMIILESTGDISIVEKNSSGRVNIVNQLKENL